MNNKAFKSQSRNNPNCDYCKQIETVEHLLYDCKEYSAPLWDEFGQCLTKTLTAHSGNEVATIKLAPLEIIYNKIHPAVKIHLKEKSFQLMVIHLIQEIKPDIVYRWMNAGTHHHRVHQTSLSPDIQHQNDIASPILRNKNHQKSITFLMLLDGTINERV